MLVSRRFVTALCALVMLTSCAPAALPPESPTTTTENAKADAVMRVVRDTMAQAHLKAVIVRVTVDGKEIVTQAVGESMTGVPATTGMHFRNGAVAISYVSTLLLKLVDEKKVSLDDKLSKWLPEIPHADRVTLGPAGPDDFGLRRLRHRQHRDERRALCKPVPALDHPRAAAVRRPPSHCSTRRAPTGTTRTPTMCCSGLALEKATGQDMPKLLSDKVLRPLGLTNTVNSITAEIPSPTLHAFTSERRAALKIPAGTPFYEESTYWDPSWTITHGAIQTTNIYDLEATARGIGSGQLLTPDSYKKMISTDLRGKTHKQPGAPPATR